MNRATFSLVLLAATAASAGNIQVPTLTLPASEPVAPALLFPASQIPTLVARTTDSNYAPYYAQVIAAVDPYLGSVASNPASLGDDTLCMIAKGAGLLYVVGRAPPSSFSSYRDVAVAALKHVQTRNPVSATNLIFGTNPPDPIDDLEDSPRLQSMLEAYDMLRGSGIASADDTAIRTTMSAWAEALRNDVNLTGAFGIGGHRDNWGVKAGSSLVSAALELSTASDAPLWLSFGMTLVNGSLAVVASDTGWDREGPHYLNYELDNMVSAAAHVLNRTGVDWHPAMKPFAQLSLAMHQPDGLMAPFEEGVPNVFPYDVLAGAYPDLAPQMMWTWQNANQSFQPIDVNYENQALHAATRFVLDVVVTAAAQSGPSTQFIGPDAHVHVLRSDWSATAVQATMITAVDDSSSTVNTTRHNMQNPMDLTVFGAGQMLLATSSGGPEVTTSPNRSYYLLPSSKNVPLVSGTAPFVTDGADISSFARLDATDDQGRSNHFVDTAHTAVTDYAGASSVDRLLAMIDNSYFVVADEASGSGTIDFTIPWHGRGAYSSLATSADAVRSSWLFSGSALDLWSFGASALSPQTVPGYYASAYGSEENVTGLWLEQHGTAPRLLTVLQTRAGSATPLAVTSLPTASGALAATVVSGASTDTLLSAPGGASTTAGALSSDGAFAAIREQGTLVSFATSAATSLAYQGQTVLSATAPITLSATLGGGGITLSLSLDQTSPVSFSLENLPGLDLVHTQFAATENDAALGATSFTQSGGALQFHNLTGPATLSVTPVAAPCDAVAYSPAKDEYGIVEFEDLFPNIGDMDFNDENIAYNYAFVLDANNQLVGLQATYNVVSIGANILNGFYVQFPVDASLISSAQVSIGGAAPVPITPVGTLPGQSGSCAQSYATFQIAADTRDLYPPGFGGFINTVPDLYLLSGNTVVLSLAFTSPLSSRVFDTGAVPYDIFTARTADASHQIHLPVYDGAATCADGSLFGQGQDGSNRDLRSHGGADNTGRWYVDANGLPWALNIPQYVDWTIERTAIDLLYPQLDTFAITAGASDSASFYLPANEDETHSWQAHLTTGAAAPPAAPPSLGSGLFSNLICTSGLDERTNNPAYYSLSILYEGPDIYGEGMGSTIGHSAVLATAGEPNLTVPPAGAGLIKTFANTLVQGTHYDVTFAARPTTGGCYLPNNSGTMESNVTLTMMCVPHVPP